MLNRSPSLPAALFTALHGPSPLPLQQPASDSFAPHHRRRPTEAGRIGPRSPPKPWGDSAVTAGIDR